MEIKMVGKRRLNGLEIALAEASRHILGQAEDISGKNQAKYIAQVRSAADELYKKFLFQEKRTGCRLMNALREMIEGWNYNECTTPREIGKSIPSTPSSICQSLDNLVRYHPEIGLRRIIGDHGPSPDYLFAKIKTRAEKKHKIKFQNDELISDYGIAKHIGDEIYFFRSTTRGVERKQLYDYGHFLLIKKSINEGRVIQQDNPKEVKEQFNIGLKIVSDIISSGRFVRDVDNDSYNSGLDIEKYAPSWAAVSHGQFISNVNTVISELVQEGLGLEVVKHEGRNIALYDPYYLGAKQNETTRHN